MARGAEGLMSIRDGILLSDVRFHEKIIFLLQSPKSLQNFPNFNLVRRSSLQLILLVMVDSQWVGTWEVNLEI